MGKKGTLFDENEFNIQGELNKTVKEKVQEKPTKKLVQRGYYITPEIAQEIKIRAAKTGKKDYEIVQEALEAYFEV